MSDVIVRFNTSCIKLDDEHFIIPGLLKINATENSTNGIYLQSNKDLTETTNNPFIDFQGYSTLNIINFDPVTGGDIGNKIVNVNFIPPATIFPGMDCENGELIKSTHDSIVQNATCVPALGPIPAGSPCEVVLHNDNEGRITTNAMAIMLFFDDATNSKNIELWDFNALEYKNFSGFPIEQNFLLEYFLNDGGIYNFSYIFEQQYNSSFAFHLPFNDPINLNGTINDMINSLQTNPVNACDLLPTNLF